MGFRSTWVAVPKSETERALALTGLATAGESDTLETGFWLLDLGEWAVVVASGWDYMERLDAPLARALATPGSSIFWYADDSSMTAQMTRFDSGEQVWSLTHSEGKPVVAGDAPKELLDAISTMRAEHDAPDAHPDVDYLYEAAHVAGEQIVGFRHDDVHPESAVLRELIPTDAPRHIERCGPLDVEAIDLPGMDTHVVLTARRKARVERILERQFDRDGELRSVIEREGFALRRGESERLYIHSPFAPIHLTIETNGLLGRKSFDVEVVAAE